MAERKTDSAEHLVDEMKRKARRRLVGAVVLALGAIIVLPLLLEKEPRPLGDDVSVQIPPVDDGKFINRLTGKAPEKALPKAESKAITATPPAPASKPEADAAPAATAPPPPPISRSEPAAPSGAPKADAAVKPAASADAGTEAKPAQVAAAPADAPASAPSAAAARPEGLFVVQLAAFADDKGANALANKLKRTGYAAYVQAVETSRGTLWRVRVGGYATRPEADAARVKLKGEGYNGIIAPAQ
jgi:DedD protein